MTAIPPELDRFTAFMAENPSPENCTAGKYYKVPCINHRSLVNASSRWGEWVPLVGPVHEDKEHINFSPWHIHVDTRFLTLKDEYEYEIALGRPVSVAHSVFELDNIAQGATLQVRRMRCRRPEPAQWIDAWFIESLEAAYAGCRVSDGRCPHRGIPLACGRSLAPGIRQCPGHGLAWGDDGQMVPMIDVYLNPTPLEP